VGKRFELIVELERCWHLSRAQEFLADGRWEEAREAIRAAANVGFDAGEVNGSDN
jgi:hypothetical protein